MNEFDCKSIRSSEFSYDDGAGCDDGGKYDRDHDHGVEFCYALPFYTSCYIFSKEKKII